MEEFVTVRTFANPIEFEMVKAYLESYEIECFGKDEISNRVYINNANGGVKLQVKADKTEEAVRLLLEGGYLKAEDLEPTPEMKWVEKIIGLFKSK